MTRTFIKGDAEETRSSFQENAENKQPSRLIDRPRSLKDIPLETRRKQAEKPIYLIRYE